MGSDVVKVRDELDATHENVVAHVVLPAIAVAFGLLLTEIRLYRDFGITRHVAACRCQESA